MNWRKLKKLLRKGGPFPDHMIGFVDVADGDKPESDAFLEFAREVAAEAQKP